MRNPRSEYSAMQGLLEGQKNIRRDLPVRRDKRFSLTFVEAIVGLAAILAIVMAISTL